MTLALHIAIVWATLITLFVGTMILNPKTDEQVAQDIRDDGF